jgi:hypothetical protein
MTSLSALHKARPLLVRLPLVGALLAVNAGRGSA